MVHIFLAQGFEEIEAIATIDILRKSGLKVNIVGIGGNFISGNVGVKVEADILDKELKDFSGISSIVIPGGYGGAKRLLKSKLVLDATRYCNEKGGVIGAICAGPSVLAKAGILKNKSITCYPGIESWIEDSSVKVTGKAVEKDGKIITAIGPGATLEFAYTLVSEILNNKASEELKKAMCYEN